MTLILAAYSLYFQELLTPAILFTTLILVDIQTTCVNVGVVHDGYHWKVARLWRDG